MARHGRSERTATILTDGQVQMQVVVEHMVKDLRSANGFEPPFGRVGAIRPSSPTDIHVGC